MSPLKTPSAPDEQIEQLLEQMIGPAIKLTGTDTDLPPYDGDNSARVRPLSRQSFNGHISESESSANPIAPPRPPKTPLDSQRPASVSLSSTSEQKTPSTEPEVAQSQGQDHEAAVANSSNQERGRPTTDSTQSAPSPTANNSTTTVPEPSELYSLDYYYPFPSHDHGLSPDQDDDPEPVYALSAASSPVTTCIDEPVTFETTWYSHFAAPKFFICSRCYADHIMPSKFRDFFQVSTPAEGKPRLCRFSNPRMKDELWKKALSSDYLQPVTDWMQLRSGITDCEGVTGVKGSEATKWYAPKLNEIPGLLVCQACFEDRVKVFPRLASYFQPHPESQTPEDVRACGWAIPFIQEEYEKQGRKGDWPSFVREAKARLKMPPCPGQGTTSAHGKTWFRPVHGPEWLVLCAACFWDRVLHAQDADQWAPDERLSRALDQQVRCPMAQFNIRTARSRAQDLGDYDVFWAAVRKLGREKFCGPRGITDGGGAWHTLHSEPPGYQVCGACHASVVEPLGLAALFRRKINVPPGATLPCCLNPAGHPRAAAGFLPRLREAYYTRSPASLAAYAEAYAALPPCPRDAPPPRGGGGLGGLNGWYGWKECTICPECHYEFARHHRGLAALMTLQNTPLEDENENETPRMCEMYSPRMRDLYILCNGTDRAAPDPKPLFELAARRRRQVLAETVGAHPHDAVVPRPSGAGPAATDSRRHEEL